MASFDHWESALNLLHRAPQLPEASLPFQGGNSVVGRVPRALPFTGEFQLPIAPKLTASLAGSHVVVGWVSPAPGFVLQQIDQLNRVTNHWVDSTNSVQITGSSNLITFPLPNGAATQFYRTRPR